MIYPKFLKNGDTIAVTSPSAGITEESKIYCFNYAKNKLNDIYKLKTFFTDNVFLDDGTGRSSSGFERGYQFNDIFNSNAKAIIASTGGDYLVEMLDFVDYKLVQSNPIWIQGYSDLTSLLYTITTITDVATIYGSNFSVFGMEKYDKSQEQYLNILFGKSDEVSGFEFYEDGFFKKEIGTEYYNLTTPTKWINLNDEKEIRIKGRLLGGCLDVLFSLVGTNYDKTKEFCDRYKEDGIIFYFESFNTNNSDLFMHLWQLKKAGWFKYCTGIIFGRPCFYQTYNGQSYNDVVKSILSSLNIPIIMDADIGHKQPSMPIINGAVAEIVSIDGNGKIKYFFD